MDWTMQGLKESWTILKRWYAIAEPVASPRVGDDFLAALSDDLNTPLGLSELHKAEDVELTGGLRLLGFSNVEERFAAKPPVDDVEIRDAIASRTAAPEAKHIKEANSFRDELAAE